MSSLYSENKCSLGRIFIPCQAWQASFLNSPPQNSLKTPWCQLNISRHHLSSSRSACSPCSCCAAGSPWGSCGAGRRRSGRSALPGGRWTGGQGGCTCESSARGALWAAPGLHLQQGRKNGQLLVNLSSFLAALVQRSSQGLFWGDSLNTHKLFWGKGMAAGQSSADSLKLWPEHSSSEAIFCPGKRTP